MSFVESIKRAKEYKPRVYSGEIPPDPSVSIDRAAVTVPTIKGVADGLRSLEVGEYLLTKVPEAARRTVVQRMAAAHRKISRQEHGREFSVSTEWFGVAVKRTK